MKVFHYQCTLRYRGFEVKSDVPIASKNKSAVAIKWFRRVNYFISGIDYWWTQTWLLLDTEINT